MARILCVHVINDEATVYASYWCQLIAQDARRVGHDVRELTGAMVTEQGLRSAIEGFQPHLVVFAGHGSSNIFTGVGYQTVMRACTNDQIMAGSSGLFISCLTGQILVPSMVSKGALAAQGYLKEYIWMVDGSGRPATDRYAASFTRTLVDAAAVILRGGSWQGWYSTFQRISQEEIDKWANSTDIVAPSVVMSLRQNKTSAVISGAGTIIEDGVDPGMQVPIIENPVLPIILGVAALSIIK